MKLMTFTTIHRRAGILAFQTSSFQLIKKDRYCNHFFFSDPYEDQFAKIIEAKKERVAKNEYQRLRNIARNKKIASELT